MNGTVKRSIFGALFLAVMLGGLLFHPIPYFILFAFITVVMLYEFYRMTMGDTYKSIQYSALFFSFLIFLEGNRYFSGKDSLEQFVCIALILLLFTMLQTILRKDHKEFLKSAYLYAGMLYITLPLTLANLVVYRTGEYSGLLMVAFFCIIWASDVGAYCFGMLFGQKSWSKKMCPSISPKKSWAGFWGGLFMAMVAGAILHFTGMVSFPLVHCLVMALLMAAAGVMGDLFESLWKRSVGMKDSGNIIPGHGGLLDRFDSSLFAIPVGVIYLIVNGLF